MSASDLSCCMVLFSMPPPGVGGGGEQSDRTRPERKRWGVNGQARVGEGVGELENSSCSVALLGCFVDLILLYYSFAYCIRILRQILCFGNPTAVLLYRNFPNQIPN